MTAVSRRTAETAHDLEPSEQTVIRWSELGFLFEIKASDQKLLKMAMRVFSAQSSAADDVPIRTWTVRQAQDDSGDWIIDGTSETSSMIPGRAETRETALLHVEQDALDWLLNNAPGAIAVHAALLSKNGKGIAIVGPSLAGKSTLATALWRKGWSLMSDDLVFIDTLVCTASPAPRRVSLRFESRELVGESLWTDIMETPSCIETSKGLFFHPHELTGHEKLRTTPLCAIFFLARREASVTAAETRKLNPAKASLSLIPYSFNVRTLPFVDGLRRITPLLEHVPAFDLGRGDLQSMVNEVELAVG